MTNSYILRPQISIRTPLERCIRRSVSLSTLLPIYFISNARKPLAALRYRVSRYRISRIRSHGYYVSVAANNTEQPSVGRCRNTNVFRSVVLDADDRNLLRETWSTRDTGGRRTTV